MKRTVFFLFVISLFFLNDIYAQEPGSGYCINFDGTNDWIQLPDIPFPDTDKTFTVEMWMDHERTAIDYFFCKWSSLNENDFMLYSENGRIG